MALWSFMTPTQSYLLHVDTRRHKHATTHPSCLWRSLPLPLFSYVLFLAQKHPHTHWTERKKRWVMRAFGSPFCHHGDTKVPPTGCVTSKECPSFPPSLYLPPSSLFLSHPWLRWWWDTLSLSHVHGQTVNVPKHTSQSQWFVCMCCLINTQTLFYCIVLQCCFILFVLFVIYKPIYPISLCSTVFVLVVYLSFILF